MYDARIDQLQKAIMEKDSAVVAFSGGVDSATLAYLAHNALGGRVVAVTVKLLSYPERELDNAKKIAAEIGIEHKIVDFDELKVPSIAANTSRRCYYCKKEILSLLAAAKDEFGFNVILEGSNASDTIVYRPGREALSEAGKLVYSPFVEHGVTKEEIRRLARHAGLSAADKPPSPCLASRFPYGDVLTRGSIGRVEIAENFLSDMGFTELRVRDHKGMARIELCPSDFRELLINREKILSYFKMIGFDYVTLDIEGFRSGSMDEIL
ncbi:hypothetical protein Mpsy_2077 [Methanolobus psychrophilus R15]|nr:hypothetical protein Mpsy_2077 [Methanolobus psychrophilus R15]